VNRLLSALRRRAALALIPLSVMPFVGIVPMIADQHDRFQREHNMGPLPAPAAALTAGETARFAAVPAVPGKIPVLAWKGIGAGRDGSTTQRAFARQLALLSEQGFTAISTAQWAAFRAGRTTALPPKPILLTIDGGRLDSYRAADGVLARAGMRAAMFVTTGAIEAGDPLSVTWTELHRMARSGRWDVEPQAHEGARRLTVAPDGTQAPFYAARRYTRSQGQETLAAWEARVSADLFALRDRFTAQGIEPHVFSVPFGDYGQLHGNDPAIPKLLSGLLDRQFGNWFVPAADGDPDFTEPGSGSAARFELRSGTTLDQLYGWLRKHAASPAPAPASAPAPQTTKR
jgi:hypothetical protein